MREQKSCSETNTSSLSCFCALEKAVSLSPLFELLLCPQKSDFQDKKNLFILSLNGLDGGSSQQTLVEVRNVFIHI